jgi:2-dehydro-3-deoxyphosphogluconate aldolase/(4S)-4-hydroxy-2-oxoglutarate aldolase
MVLLPGSVAAVLDALDAIKADRAVAVIRAKRVADPIALVETLAGAGIRAVELTFTIPNVISAIESAAAGGGLVGAGTVVHAHQARNAIAAGARFVVSPACVPEVADACRNAGVPVFLGALTPTEVDAAVKAGATGVKLFPARLGDPDYLRDLRGPFPEVLFLPSGGIDEESARAFLEAGAVAVYAGSSLAPPELVEGGRHAEIGRRARAFVASLS